MRSYEKDHKHNKNSVFLEQDGSDDLQTYLLRTVNNVSPDHILLCMHNDLFFYVCFKTYAVDTCLYIFCFSACVRIVV